MRLGDSTRALLGAAAIAAVLLALVATACSDQSMPAPGDVGANRPGAAATDKDADNTARNVRDRDDKTLTPLDRSDAPADLKMTQRIRTQIAAN